MELLKWLLIIITFGFSIYSLFSVRECSGNVKEKLDNPQRVGRFLKISFDEFYAAIQAEVGDEVPEDVVFEMYERIKMPQRSTSGSCGYDFCSPFYFTLAPGETVKIPTGIRVFMKHGWWLCCFPRSSMGFKYRMQLDNTAGVIDEDYYFSDNEGHIFIKVTNDSKNDKTLEVNPGDKFVQGIFLPYGVVFDDDATGVRNGGIGSTSV